MTENQILIVDDSEFDRNLLSLALKRKGEFKTIEARNGEECLALLETEKIGLILMDIMMPGTIGSQILLKIREKHNPVELPIIMVTSKSGTEDIIHCLQSGANDYITKPVNFEIALTRISTHLRLAELSKSMSRLKEIKAMDALIATYNHEINNPLTIAIGCLQGHSLSEETGRAKLEEALWRISDIVKKIDRITEEKDIQFEEYSESVSMLKLSKKPEKDG